MFAICFQYRFEYTRLDILLCNSSYAIDLRLCEGWLFRRHGDVDSALESTENEVLVLFQSPDPMASSPKTGFRMCTRIGE